MSNALAIATVTKVLQIELQKVAREAVQGAEVQTRRPEKIAEAAARKPVVNLFLYQVNPNRAWRNEDLPTRQPRGGLIQRPRIALDLSYLLTFYGDESELQPQRLLGAVITALHSEPTLSREAIRTIVAEKPLTFLAGSTLGEQAEQITLALQSLSLEELSKAWSVFFQIPYALSIVYVASVVLLEAELDPVEVAPVKRPVVKIAPTAAHKDGEDSEP